MPCKRVACLRLTQMLLCSSQPKYFRNDRKALDTSKRSYTSGFLMRLCLCISSEMCSDKDPKQCCRPRALFAVGRGESLQGVSPSGMQCTYVSSTSSSIHSERNKWLEYWRLACRPSSCVPKGSTLSPKFGPTRTELQIYACKGV